jgi:hypothetical protein
MKEINKYVKNVLALLDEEDFFNKAGIFMDRDIMKKFLTEAITENYETTGSPVLREHQLEDIIDRTNRYIITETFEDLLKEGLIEVAGVDENGEFLYGPKKN